MSCRRAAGAAKWIFALAGSASGLVHETEVLASVRGERLVLADTRCPG